MVKERRKKIIFLFQFVVFILIFVLLFMGINQIFLSKNENYYTYVNYKKQQENSIDILVLGSSHSMDGIDANDLDRLLKENYGLTTKTFNMSVTGMRLEQVNYRYKEAIKTQCPKIVVIETFSCAPQSTGTEEDINRWALDYMPLSFEKLSYIKTDVEEELQTSFVVPFINYHSRWNELTGEDFEAVSMKEILGKSQGSGLEAPDKPDFIGDPDDYFEQDFKKITDIKTLPDTYQQDMAEIIEIAESMGTKIIFLSIPYKVQADFYNTELIKCNNYLEKNYVDNKNIFILDMNKNIEELNWSYAYMTDEGHVNNKGRDVVEEEIAKFLGMELQSYLEEK